MTRAKMSARTPGDWTSREAKLRDMVSLLLGALQHPSVQCVSDKHLEHVRRLMGEASDLVAGSLNAYDADRALIAELTKALQAAKPELDATLEVVGGCEHDVGLCACSLIRAISLTSAALSRAEKEGA